MSSSVSIDPTVLARLQRMARAAASRFDGLEEDDFLSEAWLAYNETKDKGKSDSAAFARAEYAITDAMRDWISVPKGEVIMDGEDAREIVQVIPYNLRKTLRTKLPRKVKRLLKSLSDKDRKILYLAYMWNRTGKEISADMGIPEATVATIKHRALRRIQVELGLREPDVPKLRKSSLKGGKLMKNTYWLLSPEGKTFTITHNFKGFCELHDLNYKAMRALVNPNSTQKTHRGWIALTNTSQ